MSNVMQYITENDLVLIPVLYIIGAMIKGTEKIENKWIPFILLICGIAGAVGLNGFSVESIIQGILITGATVYADQLIKQGTK